MSVWERPTRDRLGVDHLPSPIRIMDAGGRLLRVVPAERGTAPCRHHRVRNCDRCAYAMTRDATRTEKRPWRRDPAEDR